MNLETMTHEIHGKMSVAANAPALAPALSASTDGITRSESKDKSVRSAAGNVSVWLKELLVKTCVQEI